MAMKMIQAVTNSVGITISYPHLGAGRYRGLNPHMFKPDYEAALAQLTDYEFDSYDPEDKKPYRVDEEGNKIESNENLAYYMWGLP